MVLIRHFSKREIGIQEQKKRKNSFLKDFQVNIRQDFATK